jgi:hypothetical protein
MSFMQPYIYCGPCYIVETSHGTELVPCDVVGDLGLADDAPELAKALADYVEGTIESVEYKKVFYGRYSAPGYTDCTDWTWGASAEEVSETLESMYGDAQ